MGKRLTNEEFLKRVLELVGSEYTFLDEYGGSKVKLTVYHSVCQETYQVTPNNFFTGYRCPHCFGTPKKTTAQFSNELFSKYGNAFKLLSEYTNNKTKVKVRHSCGYIHYQSADRLLQRGVCPRCSSHFIKNTKTYKQSLIAQGITTIIPVQPYVKGALKLEHTCLTCGNTWNVKPEHILRGVGCPVCVLHSKQSSGERYVESFLDAHNFQYAYPKTFEDLRDTKKLHYDFYVPSINLLIEYQGQQHYYPTLRQTEAKHAQQLGHDKLKREYAKTKGYHLLEIPFIENTPEKVSEYIQNYLANNNMM